MIIPEKGEQIRKDFTGKPEKGEGGRSRNLGQKP
jgi:hypothetical protein